MVHVIVVIWAQMVYLKYTHLHSGLRSGKPFMPMLQLIYFTWMTQLQVWETARLLCKCIYMNSDCG